MEMSTKTFEEIKEIYGLNQLDRNEMGPVYYSADQQYLVQKFKPKKKQKNALPLVEWIEQYNAISDQLTSSLLTDKHLSRRVEVLPIILSGKDYYIKHYYSNGLTTYEAEEKTKYYPDYVQLRDKLLLNIKDNNLREIIKNSLSSNTDIFWDNAETRLIFNDFTF